MQYATLTRDGPVSIVTLNRPERLNAIGLQLLQDLHEALVAAQVDTETGAIVLTGAGRAFCAGDDLKEFAQQTASSAAVIDTCERIQQITRDIMFGPKLVIGAVHGFAVGGGFEWMLNCDMVVAAEDLVAFFPEMALGHFVTGGVTHLLPQALGYQRAMELIVLGERMDGAALSITMRASTATRSPGCERRCAIRPEMGARSTVSFSDLVATSAPACAAW